MVTARDQVTHSCDLKIVGVDVGTGSSLDTIVAFGSATVCRPVIG